MKRLLSIILIIILYNSIDCQLLHAADCNGERYKEKIFDEIIIHDALVYGEKITSTGDLQVLHYDVYMPANDTETDRPVLMLAHGGGYIDFINQKSPDIVRLAEEFAHRGYVVVSVEYREEASALSLFSTENMVKAVGRALIDIRDATCFLMDTTINHGNPFGVDPNNVIVGGVSAGAVSFLQAIFLDSLSWLDQQYQDWILEVEPNTQALLDDKYCGATVKGIINISGAVLDTAWIKDYKLDEYPALMHVHGGRDPIVPFGIDHPFGIASLPELMGSSIIDEKAQEVGLRSELDVYPTQGHVPIIGLNWNALFSDEPINMIFNERIMNATLRHMTEFIYSLIDCDPLLPTGLDEHKTLSLNFFPNPTRGDFAINLPAEMSMNSGQLDIINTVGQILYTRTILPFEEQLSIRHDLPAGLYQLRYSSPGLPTTFSGQLVVTQ